MEDIKLSNSKDEIKSKFLNGYSMEELIKKYDSNWSSIYGIIQNCLSYKMDDITKEEELEIVELYQSGVSCTKIGVKYKKHHKLIAKILDKYNIKRTCESNRKHKLDEHYFDTIDSQDKAYILGLLFADGYNSIDKSSIRISLQYTDVDILLKIKDKIGSSKELIFIDCKNRKSSNGYISKDMYQLEFYSSHICKQLAKLGMIQNKSLVLEYPDIDEKYNSHFIRGYFDGDGSFCPHYTKKGYFQSMATITSTEQFCKRALDIIRRNTNVNGGIYDASSHNGITKVIGISGTNQCREFFEWMYKDADLYLERKYNLYKNTIAL